MAKKLDFYFSKSNDEKTLSSHHLTLKKELSVASKDVTGQTRVHVKNEDFVNLQGELNLQFHAYILHINIYFQGYVTIMEVDIPLDIHI